MAIKYYLHQGELGTGRTVRIDATDDLDAHRRAANVMAHSAEYGELWKAYTQAPALVTTMAIYPQREVAPSGWASVEGGARQLGAMGSAETQGGRTWIVSSCRPYALEPHIKGS